MHSPGFLGRSVLKLLEKLLILGNSGKLLEKLEGRVIVSIAPDHSVSDRTCRPGDVQLLDLTDRVRWRSSLLLKSGAVGEKQGGGLPLRVHLEPPVCRAALSSLAAWRLLLPPPVTVRPQGLSSLSREGIPWLIAVQGPLDCVLESSRLFA